MTVHLLNNFLDPILLRRALLDVRQLPLQRYDNPFERKSFLEDKSAIGIDTQRAVQELTNVHACQWISRILNVPLDHADWPHYGGVFVYEPGDYLKPHVDAGIHPTKGLRKVATALLYLTPATLVMYEGTDCTVQYPIVIGEEQRVYPHINTLVLFTNTDYAWHGVPVVKAHKRIVITVSYLAPASFSHHVFTNLKTRAYFGRCKWEVETPELAILRDQRASEQEHKEVYRYDLP